MSDYFRQCAINTTDLTKGQGWALLSSLETTLKKKIEEVGKRLKNWDVQINYGIKTGYNDAFVIDSKTKDELIKKCPNSAEIIRPILRGRDIKRYKVDYSDLWVLFIPWHFPLHNDPTITGASKAAEEAFKDKYPDIYNHLYQFKESLSKRNSAETGIRYEWYALQRFGSNYWKEFSKPKIVWGNLALQSQFAFTTEPYVVNAPSPFLATENLYLLAILNSKIGNYYIKNLGVERSGGYVEFKPMFVQEFPVPEAATEIQESISAKAYAVMELSKHSRPTQDIEAEIDKMIYSLYGLTDEEIKFLEKK